MPRRLIAMTACALMLLTVDGLVRTAGATHPRNPAKKLLFVVTARAQVALRQEPSEKAPFTVRLPTLTEVVLLDRPKKHATIGGRKDKWVYVHAVKCLADDEATPPCKNLDEVGWIPDSALAYDHRFKAVTRWRKGFIKSTGGDDTRTFRLSANGRFTYRKETWFTMRGGDTCEGQIRSRDCITKVVRKGRLYRYGKVFRPGRKSEDYLFIDRRGALCDAKSDPEEPKCDR